MPGSGGSPGRRNVDPLQPSCLENPMDRGAWWATVHGVQRVGHDQEGCIYTADSVAPGSLYPDDWHTTKGKKKCGHGAQPASPCLSLRAAVNLLSLGFARPLSLPVNSHLHQKLESVHCSVMSNSAIPWFVACQAPLSMEVSRQEYWNLLPFPTPGDLPNPGITAVSLVSPALQADSLLSES